jgi:SAM-dependent methyltransferase
MTFQELYTHGGYLATHPTWHVEESPWKARYAMRLLTRNRIVPQTICEVGCGAGEILRLLQQHMSESSRFYGYEISPHAYDMACQRANSRLQFTLGDIRDNPAARFDLILVMDVLEHMEDYFDLLRAIRPMSRYKLFHIPLDISVRSVLTGQLLEYRRAHGHIHYFTRELALQTLRDVGYEIVDSCYTKGGIFTPPQPARPWSERMHHPWNLTLALLKQGKHGAKQLAVRAMGDDWAERIFGEWRLMVLAH